MDYKKNTWREFQSELQLETRRKNYPLLYLKMLISVLIIFVTGLCLHCVTSSFIPDMTGALQNIFFGVGHDNSNNLIQDSEKKHNQLTHNQLTIDGLRNLLADNHILVNLERKNFFLNNDESIFNIHTSIDMPLQQFIISKLEILKTLERGKPERIAMVVMEPETGRVLAMAGFDLSDADFNVCTNGEFPAASTFKIVTASAVVENCGYRPDTPMYFNGGKYTLYKRQLKENKNKYTQKISFAHAFAESVNPVFGKIGSINLGGKILKKYALSFGFNQNIESDFPFKTGLIKITDRPYQWAEVGCGFNETTTISPVFAAMMSGIVLNSGRISIPCIVDRVTNADGKIIYTRKKKAGIHVINPATAKNIMKMMEKTIVMGTAKKSFHGFKRNHILSKLIIGGKTGSICNKNHTIKYDWFTGFAREKNGGKKIAFAVVVGHRKYIGIRAAMYGKMIIKKYFKTYFNLKNKKSMHASLMAESVE